MKKLRYLLLFTLCVCFGCAQKPPSDEKMISHFQSHEADFVILVDMLAKDRAMEHLSINSLRPEHSIDNQRWAEYRRVMKNVGVREAYVFRSNHPHVILISESLSYSGFIVKGYAFSNTEPTPLRSSLNIEQKVIPPYAVYYRHIKGKWYLYLQSMSE